MTTRELTIAAAVAAAFGLGGVAAAQTTQGGAANNTPGVPAQQLNPSAMPPGTRAGEAPGMANDRAPNNAPGANAQQVNPSAMPPGSRAGDAPGMGATARPGAPAPSQNLSTTGTPSGQPVGSPQAMGPGQGTSAQTMTGTGPTTAQGATNPDRGIPGGQGAQAPSAQPDVGRGTAQAQQDRGSAPGGAATGSTGGATGATTPGQGTTGGGMSSTPPAATTQHTQPRTAAAPVPGANSFTEGQARARIGDAGFNDVQDLRLDDQGVWRGRAMRNGQQTGVALDYQGNVVATQ